MFTYHQQQQQQGAEQAVSCRSWIIRGTGEHHRSGSAAVQFLLQKAAYLTMSPLEWTSGGRPAMPNESRMWQGLGMPRVAWKQHLWGWHRPWDSNSNKIIPNFNHSLDCRKVVFCASVWDAGLGFKWWQVAGDVMLTFTWLATLGSNRWCHADPSPS